MRIITGRGKRRQVFDLPHPSIVERSTRQDQERYLANMRIILGVE